MAGISVLYSDLALLVCSVVVISADEMVFAEDADISDSEEASKRDFVANVV